MDHAAIIETLGGYRRVAELTGVDPTRANHWMRDGIPRRHWPAIVMTPPLDGKAAISLDMLAKSEPAALSRRAA